MEALLSGVSLLALKAFFPLALAPGLRRRGGDGHQIERSLRFDSAGSANLSWTPGGAGDRKLLCRRVRIKRSKLGAAQVILSAGTSSIDNFYFDSSDRLCLDVLGTTRLVTTRVFRDPTAWLDVGFELDVANGTAASRAKILIEEVEATAYSTDTRSSIANSDTNWNNTVVQYIGRDNAGSYFDGYMAEPAGANATVAITYSAVNSETGVRLPVEPSATWGTNGFYLDFSDNSNTTSGTLGADRSGNGNDWTPNNFSVSAGVGNDSLTDTPTNYGTDTGAGGEVRGNYCTLNPLSKGASCTLSNGNLNAAWSGSSITQTTKSTFALSDTVDQYFEIELATNSNANGVWGIANEIAPLTSDLGADANGWGILIAASGARLRLNHNQAFGSGTFWGKTSSGFGLNTYGFYWKASTRALYIRDDTGWMNASDSNDATPLTAAFTGIPAGALFPAVGHNSGGSQSTAFNLNCGQRPFAYAAPTGAKALCTQNLPDPAIKKLSSEFVSVTGAGASDAISTALAAARPGWSSYVDILKPYDTTGAWKWRFSHDASNEYSVSTTATRASVSAPSANNWVGYSIKVGGTAGIRAGSQGHTNSGGDTTVTHNSGISARQLILLFPRSGGEVLMYHPDATASELLNLTGNEADFSSSLIKSVTANAFTIDTTHATDTYDYLVIPETEGFFKFFAHTGNASADGPAPWLGLRPALASIKVKSTTGDHYAWDAERETYNPRAAELLLNTTAAAGSTADIDLLASGLKIRATTAGYNGSTATHVGWAFGTSFKYARAA